MRCRLHLLRAASRLKLDAKRVAGGASAVAITAVSMALCYRAALYRRARTRNATRDVSAGRGSRSALAVKSTGRPPKGVHASRPIHSDCRVQVLELDACVG